MLTPKSKRKIRYYSTRAPVQVTRENHFSRICVWVSNFELIRFSNSPQIKKKIFFGEKKIYKRCSLSHSN